MKNVVAWLTLLSATGCYDRAVLLEELKAHEISGGGTSKGSEVQESGLPQTLGRPEESTVGGGAGGEQNVGGSSGSAGEHNVGGSSGSAGEHNVGGSSGSAGEHNVGGSSGSGAVPSVGGGSGASSTGPRPPKNTAVVAACSVPIAGVEIYSSQQQLEQAMVGDWYLCSDTSILCSWDEIGLRISADGTWTKLFYDTTGAVVADTKLNSWKSVDSTAMNGEGSYSLILYGSSAGAIPQDISLGGQSFYSMTSTTCAGTYVKSTALGQAGPEYKIVNGTPVELTPLATVLDDAARATCTNGSTQLDTTSLATMQSSLQGVWIACASDPAVPPSVAGLEIANDGKWYHLYADSDGRLYRGLSWGRRGSYQLLDTSGMNGPGMYQMDFEAFGPRNALPRLEYRPRQLEIIFTDVNSNGAYRKIAQ